MFCIHLFHVGWPGAISSLNQPPFLREEESRGMVFQLRPGGPVALAPAPAPMPVVPRPEPRRGAIRFLAGVLTNWLWASGVMLFCAELGQFPTPGPPRRG